MSLRFCEDCGRPIPSNFVHKKTCCRACKLRQNRKKCGKLEAPKVVWRLCVVCGEEILTTTSRKTCDDVCSEVAKFCRHQRIPLRDEPGHIPFDKDFLIPDRWGQYVISHGSKICRP